MINKQIKNDLYLLLQEINLNAISEEKIFNALNDDVQKAEVIKILRKKRYVLLEEIRNRQKVLDNLDFTINKLKKNNKILFNNYKTTIY